MIRAAALLVAALAAASRPASAHEGPPFPILVDEPAGAYSFSVWTDPDIGTATFLVFLEELADDVPPPTRVAITIQPASGRLPPATAEAVLERTRQGERWYAELEMDRRDLWSVVARVEGPAGAGEATYVDLESTPPGLRRSELVLYALPVAVVGVLWIMALRRMRAIRAEAESA